MHLSPETLAVLANFSQINPNLKLKQGNVIRTIHQSQALFAVAEIKDEIDGDAAILELGRFLRTIGLLNNPTIDFGERQFTFTDESGKTKINYTYADPTSMLEVPRSVAKINSVVDFRMSAEVLRSVIAAGKSLKLPAIRFKGGVDIPCVIELYDPKQRTRDNYVIDVTEFVEEVTSDFSSTVNIEYVNFLLRDYVVSVAANAVKFDGGDIQYMVAVDTSSK